MIIREMTLEDVNGVYEIEKNSFYIPWSKKSIIKEINENKMAIYIIALKNNKILGYAGMWHIITEGHITNIAVDEQFRKKGIGTQLVKSLIKIALQKEMIGITLEVKPTNTSAVKIYKNEGFIIEGIRKNYYSETKEDALIMWKYF